MIPRGPVQFISQPTREQLPQMMEKAKAGEQNTMFKAAFIDFGVQLLTYEQCHAKKRFVFFSLLAVCHPGFICFYCNKST